MEQHNHAVAQGADLHWKMACSLKGCSFKVAGPKHFAVREDARTSVDCLEMIPGSGLIPKGHWKLACGMEGCSFKTSKKKAKLTGVLFIKRKRNGSIQ